MNFKDLITTLRDNANLSQQDVADSLTIARATYAGLEIGRREPNLAEIRALAELYQISPTDLINGILPDKQDQAELVNFAQDSEGAMPRDDIVENPDKLREVLLYILEKVGAKPNVGETVIYKLLYFIDFDFYEKFGKSITGTTYVRNHFGPTPIAQTFSGVVDAMKSANELEVITTPYFNHTQKKYLPTVRPTLEHLSGQEIKHIDEELARLADKSATELSELSHVDTPWLATKDKEQISYQLAMYRTPLTSVKEFEDEL